MSRQSHLSANDKGDNEVIPGAVLRSPDIYLTAEKKPVKPKLRDRLMKASNEVPQLEITSVGSHKTSRNEMKEPMMTKF